MSVRALTVSALVCAILVVAGRFVFDISWQSALVLAPVFVLVLGGIAFLIVLWTKVIRDSLRGRAS